MAGVKLGKETAKKVLQLTEQTGLHGNPFRYAPQVQGEIQPVEISSSWIQQGSGAYSCEAKRLYFPNGSDTFTVSDVVLKPVYDPMSKENKPSYAIGDRVSVRASGARWEILGGGGGGGEANPLKYGTLSSTLVKGGEASVYSNAQYYLVYAKVLQPNRAISSTTPITFLKGEDGKFWLVDFDYYANLQSIAPPTLTPTNQGVTVSALSSMNTSDFQISYTFNAPWNNWTLATLPYRITSAYPQMCYCRFVQNTLNYQTHQDGYDYIASPYRYTACAVLPTGYSQFVDATPIAGTYPATQTITLTANWINEIVPSNVRANYKIQYTWSPYANREESFFTTYTDYTTPLNIPTNFTNHLYVRVAMYDSLHGTWVSVGFRYAGQYLRQA